MIPGFLLKKENLQPIAGKQKQNFSFIEKTIKAMASLMLTSVSLWYTSNKKGFLQILDERVKVIFLLSFIILLNLTHTFASLVFIFLFILVLYIISRVNVLRVYKKVFIIGFIFGFLLFAPASLNLFTKGESILTIIEFSKKYSWWVYSLPKEIAITDAGLVYVMRLTLKLIDSLSLVFLIVNTTSFEKIIRSLSFFRVPGIFLLTLTLSYKYIFILSKCVSDTFEAVKMRWLGTGDTNAAENIVTSRIDYLYKKSWERYEVSFQSMTARGFAGKVHFYYYSKPGTADYLFIALAIVIFSLVIFLNYTYA